jgi:hypothetical protein
MQEEDEWNIKTSQGIQIRVIFPHYTTITKRLQVFCGIFLHFLVYKSTPSWYNNNWYVVPSAQPTDSERKEIRQNA